MSAQRCSAQNVWACAAAVLAGVAFVALRSLPPYHAMLRPAYDELAYLELANDMAEAGGWSTIVPRCLDGTYREANRHPLYLLVLASFAERDPKFYTQAKFASWLVGLVATGVLLTVVSQISGASGVVLVALLLGHNDSWLGMICTIAVEMLLFILLAAAWYFICFRANSPGAQAMAGVCLGLAYLTKATALIVLLAFILSQIVSHGIRGLRNRSLWIALAGWLVVSSPLLARNAIVFGAPFYNVNSKYMWLDDWSHVKLMDEESIAAQSAGRFIEKNGFGALAVRFVGGLVREAAYLLTSLSLFHDRVSMAAVLVGLVPLGVGLLGMRRLPTPSARAFSGWMLVGFLSALALHTPHASHPRFQLTVLPVVYASVSLELASWLLILGSLMARKVAGISTMIEFADRLKVLPETAESHGRLEWVWIGFAAALAVISVAAGQSWSATWPLRLLQASPPAERELSMAAWMSDHVLPNDRVVLSGGIDFSPYWYRKIRGEVLEFPAGVDRAAFESWAARRGVTCVVTDVRRTPRWAFDWPDSPHDSETGTVPDGWTLEFEAAPLRFYRRDHRR